MVWEGLNVVKTGRMMLGETNQADSKPGTIRGDFCIQVGRNIIHGSDSLQSAEKEISLWFKPEELIDYKSCAHDWVHERDGELWVLFSISDGSLGTTLHSTEWIIFSKTIKTLELEKKKKNLEFLEFLSHVKSHDMGQKEI
ncbi:hypothetical protein U0070_007361 [Myodes glareolus]|uniref:Nucleoside diphosphate kinase n=1 Tax=Myodes glareolus TaxID=447135 RepID=A0AAW0HUZ7_MYOGA